MQKKMGLSPPRDVSVSRTAEPRLGQSRDFSSLGHQFIVNQGWQVEGPLKPPKHPITMVLKCLRWTVSRTAHPVLVTSQPCVLIVRGLLSIMDGNLRDPLKPPKQHSTMVLKCWRWTVHREMAVSPPGQLHPVLVTIVLIVLAFCPRRALACFMSSNPLRYCPYVSRTLSYEPSLKPLATI